VDVTVTTHGGTSATGAGDKFSYDPVPTVTGVSPGTGPLAGGTSVTLTGTGFAGATAVHFGSAVAGSFTVVSATSITVATPAGSAGTVDATVTTPGGTSATGSADQFTYANPPPVTPAISAISPAVGPLGGGTPVTITGTNLAGATSVSFGSRPAIFLAVPTATKIVAVSPPAPAGPVAVRVTTPDGTSETVPGATFTYVEAPRLTIVAADAIAARSATLRDKVDPRGQELTTCRFDYGTTRSYGHSVACGQQVGAVSSDVAVSAGLAGLVPATRYHYRFFATTAGGTSGGPDQTFSTAHLQAVAAPRVGLVLVPVNNSPGTVGKLLGIQGISGTVLGETIVVRCVKACSRPLRLEIQLTNRRILRRRIKLARALPLSARTRIEIDVMATGKLSRYARYAFALSGSGLAVHLTSSGCRSEAGHFVQCPARS
jgi:hypothetical protein